MQHKFAIGTAVYYEGGFLSAAARGAYKIHEAVAGRTGQQDFLPDQESRRDF
jgi:hypothetical protein